MKTIVKEEISFENPLIYYALKVLEERINKIYNADLLARLDILEGKLDLLIQDMLDKEGVEK